MEERHLPFCAVEDTDTIDSPIYSEIKEFMEDISLKGSCVIKSCKKKNHVGYIVEKESEDNSVDVDHEWTRINRSREESSSK